MPGPNYCIKTHKLHRRSYNEDDLDKLLLTWNTIYCFVSGLSMILYSEDFEYIDELAMSRGFRIHIHPFNTYASLVQQGLSLETGKQTYIGMKMVWL